MQKLFRLLIRLAMSAGLILAITLATAAIIISDGRVLDLRIGLSQESPLIFMISAAFWLLILWAAYMFAAGGWREHLNLKRALLTGLLIVPIALILAQLIGPQTSDWRFAALLGALSLFAALIADRLIPRVDRPDLK